MGGVADRAARSGLTVGGVVGDVRSGVFWIIPVFLLVIAAVGAGMVAAGIRMMRRPPTVHRVPIDAVVVECSMTRPRKVTFDYPAPDGTWLRATRYSPMPQVQARQGWSVGAGDRVRVYVNPANPVDVNLGALGTAGGFLAFFLIMVGGFMVLVSLVWAPHLLRGW